MKLKNLLAAASICLLPVLAQAGVIYEWRALNNEAPQDFKLTLEFDHSAVRAGSLNLRLGDSDIEHPILNSPLLSLRYSAAGLSFSLLPRIEPMANKSAFVRMLIDFEPGGFLSGRIFAATMNESFELESHGRLFTVLHANSDAGMPGCPWAPIQCSGATGQLRQIPEPAPFALLAAGLAAAGLVFRRKAHRTR